MELSEKLDRVFGLKQVFVEENQVLDANKWQAADPDHLNKLAFSKSTGARMNALLRILRDLGEYDLLNTIKKYDSENPNSRNLAYELYKQARKEARKEANKRAAIDPTRRGKVLRRREAEAPAAGIEKSPESKLVDLAQAREKPDRERPDDYRWAIMDVDTGEYAKDDQGHAITAETEDDAQALIDGEVDMFPDPDQYTPKRIENPKSLKALSKIVKPLQNGWTMDEVVKALMPYIRSLSWKFRNEKADFDDLTQTGALAVHNAIETDKGIAPFAWHAYPHVKGAIMNTALRGGVVSGGERTFRQKGPISGYTILWREPEDNPDEEPRSIHFGSKEMTGAQYGGTARAEAGKGGRSDPGLEKAKQMQDRLRERGIISAIRPERQRLASMASKLKGSEGQTELGDTVKATKVASPEFITQQQELFNMLMDKAELNDKEKEVMRMAYGLDVPEAGLRGPSYSGRDQGVFGPPESGEKERKPGEQWGIPSPTAQGKLLRRHAGELEGEPEARGPVEISDILGMPRSTVKRNFQSGSKKLYKARDELYKQYPHLRPFMNKAFGKKKAEEPVGKPTKKAARKPKPATVPAAAPGQYDQETLDWAQKHGFPPEQAAIMMQALRSAGKLDDSLDRIFDGELDQLDERFGRKEVPNIKATNYYCARCGETTRHSLRGDKSTCEKCGAIKSKVTESQAVYEANIMYRTFLKATRKIRKAAIEEIDERSKHILEGIDEQEIKNLLEIEDICRQHLIKAIVSGDYNDIV